MTKAGKFALTMVSGAVWMFVGGLLTALIAAEFGADPMLTWLLGISVGVTFVRFMDAVEVVLGAACGQNTEGE